jgi:ATP-binding cassette subfamily B multidrug efflux pump
MIKLISVDYMPEKVPSLPNKVVPFIWYFISQFKTQFFAILCVWGLSNAILGSKPYFFKLFIEAFEKAETKEMIFSYILLPAGLFTLLVLIIQPILAQTGNWLQAKSIPTFVNLTRRQLAVYTHHHSFEYFQSDFAGRLAGKVVETPGAIGDIVYHLLGGIWFAVVYVAVAIFFFSTAHWVFAAISLVWLTLYAILLWHYIPKIQAQSKKGSTERSVVRGRFVDTITNILTVKLFARAQHEDSYFLESLNNTAREFEKMDLIMFWMWTWLEVLTTAFWLAVIGGMIWSWQMGFIAASDVAMILPLALQVTQTSWWMSELFTSFFQRFGEIQEGMEVITKTHDVTDKKDAGPISVNKGAIEYKNVKFSYGSKEVFENLNIEIPSGQKLGLVGPSGAGKSTLVQILLRLFDLQDGKILIDNQDISSVTQDSLRSHIAVIPQMSDLLHRTIRDNISYGRLDASEEDIIEAAKRANAHEFILELVDKEGRTAYDAEVGERGVRLSGGQRQRIAIARAILKNAPILVLDEATSSLDSESERLIQESLFDLMEGKTVIAIAHRLSTIAHLDRLLVIEDGKIVEDGSHKELLKKQGPYARLWNMQSGGFIGVDEKDAA